MLDHEVCLVLNHEGCLVLDHEGCLMLNHEGCLMLDRGWKDRGWWRVLRILVLRGRIMLRLGKHEVHQGHEVEHLLGGGRRSVKGGRLVVA